MLATKVENRSRSNTTTRQTPSHLYLPQPHGAQLQVLSEARRLNCLVMGRRWGKTVLGGVLLVNGAVDGYPVGWFAPTYKMLGDLWREVAGWVNGFTTSVNVSERRIELRGGGSIEMWSLDNPDAARGRKYARIAIDEAAMIPCLEEAWQAVIRPTLTDYRGDAWMLSTPRGMGYFKTCFDYGQDPYRPEWASWQMPTTSNPYIDPSEVDAARHDMTERRFQQEYMAQFLEGEGYVFRNVNECSAAERVEPYPGTFVAGVDFGRSNDFTAVCVVDAATKHEVALDRFNGPDWTIQRSRILATLERWKVATAYMELNSFGGPNVEEMRKLKPALGIQDFTTTAATKRAVVENLVLELENKSCRLLAPDAGEHAAQGVAELLAYESTELPSGTLRYSAPEGQHDDTVIARCLAYWAAATRHEWEVF